MKPKELRKKTTEELLKLKKQLEFDKIKASSVWGREKVKNKEAGITTKYGAKKGEKTSLQKQIRRVIAQINTIINERNIQLETERRLKNGNTRRT